jgi:hypothetical protein
MNNIQKLHNDINDKVGFYNEASKYFKVKAISIRNNWFGTLPNVPDKNEDELIRLLQNYIKTERKR